MQRVLPALCIAIVVLLAGCGGLNPLGGSQENPADNETDTPVNESRTDGTGEDNDGLSKQREEELGTDPQKNDTDGDGLNDYRESILSTDPLSADTDGDGLDDGRELFLDTDPTRADTDGDGLTDLEESKADVSPVLADTDNDGLSDSRERDIGADPTDQDTDDDGLPDGAEVATDVLPNAPGGPPVPPARRAEVATDVLPNADPMQKDLFVEIDYMRDYQPSEESLTDLVTAFENAPVTNPDGSIGISLHLVVDEQIPFSEQTKAGAHREIATEYFDGVCLGYHYATIVNNPVIPDNQRDEGGFQNSGVGIAVATNPRGLALDLVFAHELGHDLGLGPEIPGVDSTAISMNTYPSTMNYNTPSDFVGFSDGSNGEEDHDDWATINESLDDVNSERFTDSVTGPEKCGNSTANSDGFEDQSDGSEGPTNSPTESIETFYEAVDSGGESEIRGTFHSEFPSDPVTEVSGSLGTQGEVSVETVSVKTEGPSEDEIRDVVGEKWNEEELRQIVDVATGADSSALVEVKIEVSVGKDSRSTTQTFVVATDRSTYKLLG